MRPEARDAAYLQDILDAGREALALTAGTGREGFQRDRTLQLGVERLMTIVGEAARRVSETFKSAHPEMPWAGMIAFRNVLIHEYGTIRGDRVWHILTADVPPMLAIVERLLGDAAGE